jgi:hypothetical protein
MASTCWRCLCAPRRTDENWTTSVSKRPMLVMAHTTADVEPVLLESWCDA